MHVACDDVLYFEVYIYKLRLLARYYFPIFLLLAKKTVGEELRFWVRLLHTGEHQHLGRCVPGPPA